MSNKQTAVEDFFDELVNLGFIEFANDPLIQERYQQAKEMEKQQIMDAFDTAFKDSGLSYLTGETYYKETYGE
jgi:hypothetical protein